MRKIDTPACALAPIPTGASLVPTDLAEAARAFAAGAKSLRTREAYRSAWRAFTAWCAEHGRGSLPATPETIALYATARAREGRRVATIDQALAAIGEAHKLADHESPRASATVREVMKGIRRQLGVAPSQKTPVLVGDLRAMVGALPETLLGIRDRALLLVGFAGAFRRSELVALDAADVAFSIGGLEIMLRRSKTDQEREGRKVGIPYGSAPKTCPVRSLRAWLDAAGILEGPIFRQVTRHGHVSASRLASRSIARIVKRAARGAALDPTNIAGHSLRAGLATAAAKAGKSERAIMRQTGHRSERMVRRYIRDADLFSDNAAAGLL